MRLWTINQVERSLRRGAKRRQVGGWHDWFAWRPVKVRNRNHDRRWMEVVRRRKGDMGNWIYETIGD